MSLMTDKIVVYTTHCPQCNMLIKLLENKEIQYSVVDKEEDVMAAANEAGIRTVPFCLIPGDTKVKTFQETLTYINSL